MNKIFFALAATALTASYNTAAHASYTPEDLNVWRNEDGVVYTTARTGANKPVMVSLVLPGTQSASVVISFFTPPPCDPNKHKADIWINSELLALDYRCNSFQHETISSYVISSAQKSNEIYSGLMEGAPLIINRQLMVSASNIKNLQ